MKGVIVTGVRLEWLQQNIEQRGLMPGGAVTVADSNGVILARNPDQQRFVGQKIPDRFGNLLKAAAPGTTEIVGEDGQSRIVAYQPISLPRQPLYVAAGVDKDFAFAPINRATLYGLATIVFGAALSIGLVILISTRFILAPIGQIVQALDRWRNGESVDRLATTIQRGDLGTVADAIDRLFDEIESRRQAGEKSAKVQALLNRELSHRVKNTLAIVQSMARQSFRQTDRSRYDTFAQRLTALSAAHDVLLAGEWQSASLHDLTETTLRPYLDQSNPRIEMLGSNVMLPPKAILPMSLVINELATNASKHGALSVDRGHVRLSWETLGGSLLLTWKEAGGPSDPSHVSEGFGSKLIRNAFQPELDAKPHWQFEAGGLTFFLSLRQGPLSGSEAGYHPLETDGSNSTLALWLKPNA